MKVAALPRMPCTMVGSEPPPSVSCIEDIASRSLALRTKKKNKVEGTVFSRQRCTHGFVDKMLSVLKEK